jgi:hypothetical protein
MPSELVTLLATPGKTECVKLLLIVRRAERDAAMPRRAHSKEANAPTVIDQGCPPEESGAQQPS